MQVFGNYIISIGEVLLSVLCPQEYLKKFGYIDEPNAGQRIQHFSQAVRRFQRFAGLKVTGNLTDEERRPML